MTTIDQLSQKAAELADRSGAIADEVVSLTEDILNLQVEANKVTVSGVDPFIFSITVFMLACFVGYYVVWKVTPALHTPLMSVTNAISSIIVVGAILATGASAFGDITSKLGLFAVLLTSINIVGGFVVTQRMLHMFKKKDKS